MGQGTAQVPHGGARAQEGQTARVGPGHDPGGRARHLRLYPVEQRVNVIGRGQADGLPHFQAIRPQVLVLRNPTHQSLLPSDEQCCVMPTQLLGTTSACEPHGGRHSRADAPLLARPCITVVQVWWANGALATLATLATSRAASITAAGAWRRSPALPSAAPRRRGAHLRPGRHLRAARARAELGQRAVQDGDRVVEVDRVHRQPLVQVLARRQLDRLAHAPAAQRRVDVPLEREALARRAAAGRGSAASPSGRGHCLWWSPAGQGAGWRRKRGRRRRVSRGGWTVIDRAAEQRHSSACTHGYGSSLLGSSPS